MELCLKLVYYPAKKPGLCSLSGKYTYIIHSSPQNSILKIKNKNITRTQAVTAFATQLYCKCSEYFTAFNKCIVHSDPKQQAMNLLAVHAEDMLFVAG